MKPDTILVLNSKDGLHWDTGVSTGMGVGRLQDITVGPDGTLVARRRDRRRQPT
ncbi:hypothetical protein AB0F72_03760 [Actinoplanes sp. NPDC023936]|uniref:hypothetical protein n=1 Tax=Actinoplanes sp. NPDC023936 TaxID=3154910 RepID=UPI0033F8BF2A